MYQQNDPYQNNAPYQNFQQPNNMYHNPMPGQMQGPTMVGNQGMVGGPGPMMVGGHMMPGTIAVQINTCPPAWEAGLFQNQLCGCLDDFPTCMMSWCCPCIQYGQNYEEINREGCFIQGLLFCLLRGVGLHCLIHMGLRKEIRSKFNIIGDDCNDCLLTWCCSCCTLAQDAREIEWRKQEGARRGIPF